MGHKKALVVYLVLCCATVLTILLSVWTTTGMFFTVHRSEEQTINPVGDPFVCLPVRRHPWHGKVQPEVPGLFINSTVYSSWTKEGNAMDVVGHLHSKMCPESSALPKVPLTFPDILLIVDFNSPNLYRVIPYLELLYRRHFADILYCGDDPETLKDIIVQKNITFPVYFLYIPDYAWQMKYRCLEYAMKMCGDYKGYLLIGDDTLVNVKTLKALGKDRVLVGKDFLRWVVNTTHFNEDWMWWELEGGRNAMLGVLNELVYRALHEHDVFAKQFLHRYYTFVNSSTIFYRVATDFVYVPTRLAPFFLYMTSLFRKYGTNIELAMPFFACGLAHPKDVILAKVQDLWGNRDKAVQLFTSDILYLHPFKYGTDFKTPAGQEFICETYLRDASL
ncbi:uncharacterized protein LOC112561705 isoform X2 [Pomacea canaliculata]|nr:uncharacterized protein LOC112561705 isoform X2 [Pomacea canaliculata]XP_025090110.1 uncharacterized protein LOC112561705 isoform X2 [Pomacea canaliculata]XP_025090111.1 uncharacterized protein LOC112561705 isoform X2 [Pomacea canaliculata]XP_025090112.1 uncharacterized protein LOC112561705 isoform X2 [Pomacea canaliculata]